MKIACTGSTGRVGRLLVKDYGVVPLTADITDSDAVERELDTVKPHVVLHLAGISNVDYCEVPAHWNEVMKVNFTGSVNVFRACNDRKILTGYLSTEHVYSGKSFLWWGGGPYKEVQWPDKHVVNSYALSKLAVEGLRATFPVVKVVRTSYLFDYVRLMEDELTTPGVHKYPTFIHRSYMYIPHFVKQLSIYANSIAQMPSVLHLAGSKTVSQYEFMKDFVGTFGLTQYNIQPRSTEVEHAAQRPHKAGLNVRLSAALGFPQYSYLDGFTQMKADVVRG